MHPALVVKVYVPASAKLILFSVRSDPFKALLFPLGPLILNGVPFGVILKSREAPSLIKRLLAPST